MDSLFVNETEFFNATIGVIDIGSNSVRCSVFLKGKALARTLVTSRLGEGVILGKLLQTSMDRTVSAIKSLISFAKDNGATAICAFATQAVRCAENGKDFLKIVYAETGLNVYLARGEEEAELALTGALSEKDGAVIDLGGASTELAVQQKGKKVYAKSVALGAVVLRDLCGRDKTALTRVIDGKLPEYGCVPQVDKVVAIGGTATSLAVYAKRMKTYDPLITDGTVISMEELEGIVKELELISPEEILNRACVDKKRSEILFGGALLLYSVANACGANCLEISEKDNLEGFYESVRSGKIAPDLLYVNA